MTMRSVHDKFWSDGWVRKLNALDRYLFLYLLTNEHTSWCGVYELDLGMMAFESGVDERDLEKTMLPRLAPKAIYVDGWVYIPNWVKYHHSETGSLSPQQKEGINKAWDKVPERIRLRIKEIEVEGIPYGYPMVGVSPSSLSLSSTSIPAAAPLTYSKEDEKPKKESSAKYPHALEVFALWGEYPRAWLSMKHTDQREAAENIYLDLGLEEIKNCLVFLEKHGKEKFCPKIYSPYDLQEKYKQLEAYSNETP